MIKLLLLAGLSLFSPFLFGQTQVDDLVRQGIEYHDKGQYDKAIELYKKALAMEPNSALVNSEIAMTYMYAKDYDNSIKHCDKVIDLNDKYLVQNYITKGSCLDYLGKTDESIKLFEKAVKKFGDNYLLYYNLGYDYYKVKNYDKAQETLIKAIKTKTSHASSHLLLGYVMTDLNKNVQSLLCLHYFLLLEPTSERSKAAYTLLRTQFAGNVERDTAKANVTHIMLGKEPDGEFGPAELMIGMLEASKSLDENKNKSEDQLFIENTTSFFDVLGELKNKKNAGIWWDFYIPFFYQLAKSKHMDTYCYFISGSVNERADEWVRSNPDRIQQFEAWLQK